MTCTLYSSVFIWQDTYVIIQLGLRCTVNCSFNTILTNFITYILLSHEMKRMFIIVRYIILITIPTFLIIYFQTSFVVVVNWFFFVNKSQIFILVYSWSSILVSVLNSDDFNVKNEGDKEYIVVDCEVINFTSVIAINRSFNDIKILLVESFHVSYSYHFHFHEIYTSLLTFPVSVLFSLIDWVRVMLIGTVSI